MRYFIPLLFSSSLAAQSVPTTVLQKPTAELAETFTQIAGVRELGDGRVYVSDGSDKIVGLVDFTANKITKVGRRGAGPGEFGYPSRLFATRGDTTLLYDIANGRLLALLPDGKTGSTQLIDTPVPGNNSFRYIDESGRIYLDTRPYGNNSGVEDVHLVRFDPRSKRVDTVTRISLPHGRSTGARDLGGGRLLRTNNMPYAKEDVSAIGPDGRVAVVRASDYHVEWFGTDGKRISGPPVAYQPIPLNAAEKRAWLLRRVVPGQIIVSGTPGASALPIPRGAAPPTDALDDTGMQWPTQMPAFVGGAATIASDGALWVLRTRVHTDSVPAYDVFDAAGKLTRRVALPKNTRLVGFGRGTVYVVLKDEDDLEHLQRYSLR